MLFLLVVSKKITIFALMKRRIIIVWLLMVLSIANAWADDVSERMAEAYAMRFAYSYFGVDFDETEFKLQGQVCGLYVFSMSEAGGFVIVSNDDRTLHILGFSETGVLDLENMPDEQRAWLQGYADEIAWLKLHDASIAPMGTISGARAGSHEKETIEPLLTTTWAQRAPYNDLCPEYASGKRAVTGCVATAMAQVMNYHKWPVAATEAIPGYQDGYGVYQTALEATTFNWGNMLDSYSGGETTEQNTAVATLMQYCGYSVEMNYGSTSGTNMFKVAPALKTYFGYNETTTYLSRSFYTNDKWEDIIYHELASNRPVIYGGQSTGGGHAFVCDGYRHEYATDFFHINWGWGGKSDEYYVLSVLDPYSGQGTGGSSSNGGFYFGQEAIVGIQKSSDNGTTADITPAIIDLTANSMTLSNDTIILGETETITLNITNNSSDDFDGDIYVGISGRLLVGGNFSISAGQTQDCVLTYKPTATGTYNLLFYEPLANGYYGSKGGVLATMTVVKETPPEPEPEPKPDPVPEPDPEPEPEFPAPTNLTVSDITTSSAVVSWEGSASSYDVRYGLVPESTDDHQEWLKYDDDDISKLSVQGFSLPETTWGVMFPGSMVKGNKLTKVAIYESTYNTDDITVNIYSGGDNAPATLLYTETVVPVKDGYHEVTLASPVTITAGENLWVTLTEKGQYPVACYQPETVTPNNQWLLYNDKWYITSDLLPGFAYGWRIHAFVETESLDAMEWSSPVSCTELSFTLTGLIAGKDYVAQVRGNYGSENYSDWETTTFSTSEESVLPEPDPDGIKSVLVESEEDGEWYTLDGRRLNGRPTMRGLYIRNKRIVIE